MSPAIVASLSWPVLALIVMIVQFLIIWRLRVRVRDLEQYEYAYYTLSVQPQPSQPVQPFQSRPLPRSRRLYR